jgi:hypothetical protein
VTVSIQTANCNSLKNYLVYLLKLQNYEMMSGKNLKNYLTFLCNNNDKEKNDSSKSTHLLLTVELEKMEFKKADFILKNSTANITFLVPSDSHTIEASLKIFQIYYNLGINVLS